LPQSTPFSLSESIALLVSLGADTKTKDNGMTIASILKRFKEAVDGAANANEDEETQIEFGRSLMELGRRRSGSRA
jgi:hypothetical protein